MGNKLCAKKRKVLSDEEREKIRQEKK